MLLLPTKHELIAAYRERKNHHTWLLASALAYTAMLSLAPLLLVILGIAGIFYQQEALHSEVLGTINQLVGPEAAALIREALDAGQKNIHGYIAAIVGTIIAIVGAIRIFYQLQQSANIIWEVPRADGFSHKTLLRYIVIFLVIGLTSILVIISTLASAILTSQSALIASVIGESSVVLKVAQALVSFSLLVLLFSLLYKILPETRIRWKHVWFAGLFTALLFNVGKYGMAWYLAIGSFGSIYGAAGSFIALMIWMFFAARIFLYGIELVRVRQLAEG